MLIWYVGGLIFLATISHAIHARRPFRLGLGTDGANQFMKNEVNQSLPAGVLGMVADLALLGFIGWAPSLGWLPTFPAQVVTAVVEVVSGTPGEATWWVVAKTAGGLIVWVAIRYRVGNFKHNL